MYDHDDLNSPSHQPSVVSPCSDRPPQFNWRNCGYDCGEGCEKPSEDEGGAGVSDEETAVDADEDQSSMTESQDEDVGMAHDINDSTTGSSDQDPTDCINTVVYGQPPEGSLIVEPCVTADHSPFAHSPVTSTGGSTRSRSPDPGILYWISSMSFATPLPIGIEYHFLQTPLRLSPQYEHCRGDPASHLVVPDRSPLWYLVEQSWNGYAPAYGYISPP
ncbi:hypothetical protein AA0119_g7218 [Alternaria tenuissima]|jgi:hypothetical protein|uniref:Uncharacterized protein n=1 Tax=Alternaria tenuissima TaxID=119927 RepID=A0ABY0G668_9PLEO|nr:hypothetical protein AALT_g5518 [Alternaria alternata]RYN97659.1 hypothetical protein AA0119_g7218 [Alternaria tenuissima]RYO15491.1 hypothetical protein AA0121_g6840 [Alternaria tenuissima]